jgi:hypothetical protein
MSVQRLCMQDQVTGCWFVCGTKSLGMQGLDRLDLLANRLHHLTPHLQLLGQLALPNEKELHASAHVCGTKSLLLVLYAPPGQRHLVFSISGDRRSS